MPYRKAAIRPLDPEDESVLFNLARAVFGDFRGWSDRQTLEVLETDTVFVAQVERSPAGYVALISVGEVTRIDQLLVAPHHEAEGVGRQLVQYAEGYAVSIRSRALQAIVEQDNRRALAFYRRYGFRPVERDLVELVLPQQ